MKAARQNLISGLLPQVMGGGVVNLQYADDILLFLEDNIEKTQTLRWLLVCFEQMSGMKINYDKSDLLTIGLSPDNSNEYAMVFCCKLSEFPIKYFGVPLHFTKLRRVDLQHVIDKIIKRIGGWRGILLSYVGRLTLLRACLASIPIYLLSIIKFPRWAIEMISSQMAHFLWNNTEDRHRYCWHFLATPPRADTMVYPRQRRQKCRWSWHPIIPPLGPGDPNDSTMEHQPPIGLYVYTHYGTLTPDRSLRLQTQSISVRIYRCSISPESIQGIVIYIFPREAKDNKWSDMSMSKANIRA
jgi:hypothetical protein